MTERLHSNTEEIFHKILSGTAGEEEKRDFYQAIEKDDDLRDTYHHYKNLYTLSKGQNRHDQKLSTEHFTRFWNRTHPSIYRRIQPLFKYAAIVLLAILSGYLIRTFSPTPEPETFLIQQVEYNSKKGSISSINMEDSSVIWLSSNTQLTIEKYSDGKVMARLNGEAFFDLVPDSERDFCVDLGPIRVRDIGTEFNVRAYEDESLISVTLAKGKVDMLKSSNEPLLSVKPGEMVLFDKQTRSMTVSEEDPARVSAWKNGKFVFIDQALSEISRELENWYNVEIIIENEDLKDTKYTSVVQRKSTVDCVLKMLTLTDNVQYEIINREEKCDMVRIY